MRRYALIVTAVAYVWPTTPLLQLRAALCVVLLAAMRLLNLAVPILYRDVVNTFRRGGTPAPAPTAHGGPAHRRCVAASTCCTAVIRV